MQTRIPDTSLMQLSELVASEMGLHFPKGRWRDLSRGIASAAEELGFANTQSCIQRLLSSSLAREQIEVLASYLTIGETYFFRGNKSLDFLEHHIVPELIRCRQGHEQRLRIWSAGCCTGEEPYSIAMILKKVIPNISDWDITVLATDINPRFIQRAKEGHYREWSFRSTPDWVRQQHFKDAGQGLYKIHPRIRDMVQFSYLNLAEDIFPSLLNNTNAMDVIFCRNVLMYFLPELMQKVIRRFRRCLVDGGWLIVSPSEASSLLFSEFATRNVAGEILYQNDRREVFSEDGVSPVTMAPPPMVMRRGAGWQSPPTLPDNAPLPAPETKPVVIQASPAPPIAGPLFPAPPPAPTIAEPVPPATPAPLVAAPPDLTEIYEQGLALYEQGAHRGAAAKLHDLFSHRTGENMPSSVRGKATALMARVYANQGELSRAQEWCEKAIAADKLEPSLHYLLATILQEQEQMAEAAGELRRAVYLDQDFILAHFAMGNLFLLQNKRKEAARYFKNARALLGEMEKEDLVPESEGMTAGRLLDIISSITGEESRT